MKALIVPGIPVNPTKNWTFQVGTVSLHLNTLEADGRGDLKQVEVREQAINHAINLTDSR